MCAVGLGLEPGLLEPGSVRSPFTTPPKSPIVGLESFAESKILWLGCRFCFISCRPSNGNKTRLCHLKVLKIKRKPATNHPLWAAQDLGVEWGWGRVPSPDWAWEGLLLATASHCPEARRGCCLAGPGASQGLSRVSREFSALFPEDLGTERWVESRPWSKYRPLAAV